MEQLYFARPFLLLGLFIVLSLGQLGCSASVDSNGDLPSSGRSPTTTLPSGAGGFDSHGIVRTEFVTSGKKTTDWAYAMAQQADGKILIAGESIADKSQFALVRHNADGTLDTSFNLTGKVTTDFGGWSEYARAIAVQSDGKILLAGTSDYNFAVVRYNTDGSLDTSFNSTGKVLTDLGSRSTDYAFAIAVQSDGRILVAGHSNASGLNDFAVVRYNANGTIDTSFGSAGKVLTDLGSNSWDIASAMALQSDGKILVAGYSDGSGSNDFALVRYNTNGTLDASFGSSGKVLTDLGVNSADYIKAVFVQSDGKILVAGPSNASGSDDFAVVRYNTDGTLDTSFNSTGKVLTDLGLGSNDQANSIIVQGDGKILVAGTSNASGTDDFAIVRYNSDGTLDTSFGSGGKGRTDIGASSSDQAYALVMQSDGKISVAGQSNASGSDDFALVRYNADGTLDASFNSTGKVLTDFGAGSYEYASAIVKQVDGKIIVAGSSNASGSDDFAVTRYNVDGTLDSTFGSAGKVLTDIGSSSTDWTSAIAVQSDGKILVAGTSDASGSDDIVVVRYNVDGTLDTSFGSSGKLLTDVGAASSDDAYAMVIQGDGKIVVAGSSNASGSNDFVVVRCNSDGTLDTSFNSTGKVLTDLGSNSSDIAAAITVQSDGKILVAGFSNALGSNDFAIVRYKTDGSLDTGFNFTGKVLADLGSNSSDNAKGIAVQSDGKILVAGFSNASGSTGFALVRYNSNGSMDTGFGSSGKVLTDFGAGSWSPAYAMAMQSDGKILLTGVSYAPGSNAGDLALVRYNGNGTLDTSFNSTGIAVADLGSNDDEGYSIVLEDDGKILVAGETIPNGTWDMVLVRFNADGSR
jgi:uncharacterized delta-60 repeat protein